jgi:hypothetical protein
LEFKDLVTNIVQAKIELGTYYTPSSVLTSVITNTTPNEPKQYTTNNVSNIRVPGNTSLRMFRVNDSNFAYIISTINSTSNRITSINGISVNFWVYCKKFNTNTPNDSETFVSIRDISGGGMTSYYNNSTQNGLYLFYGSGNSYTSFSSQGFDRNGMRWTMFTFTLFMNISNVVTQSFYRDGALVGSYSWTRNPSSSPTDFNPYKALNIDGCGRIQGYLDQYTVHDKVLTQSEITAIYNDTGNIQYM